MQYVVAFGCSLCVLLSVVAEREEERMHGSLATMPNSCTSHLNILASDELVKTIYFIGGTKGNLRHLFSGGDRDVQY